MTLRNILNFLDITWHLIFFNLIIRNRCIIIYQIVKEKSLIILSWTYSNSGQLSCIVCKSNIKDDSTWSDHINSKVHKENITKRKPESSKMTERLSVTTESLKRTLPKQESFVPPKKLKGYFKVNFCLCVLHFWVVIYVWIRLGILKNYTAPPVVPSVPSDFFQSPLPTSSIKTNVDEVTEEKMEDQPENFDDTNLDKGELPKGFFDDPMLDAKVSFCAYKVSFIKNMLYVLYNIKYVLLLDSKRGIC